ncbi:MAG: starch-binding protein [Oscillospiraceae bacterium]|nr:starch-binding protein [Oscillospiraceae bacterium]
MKQNKTLRRVFSLLLCLSMVLVYIPVSAFAVNMTGGEKLYLKPNSNWTQANARFAAYFFGTGNTWASMTPVAGETNLYEVTVPTGNWTNVIFCRMNPSNAANGWDTKWNQTADLTYDGTNNCYTVKEDPKNWDKGDGTWSAYTPPVPGTPTFAINLEITGEGTVNVSESAHEGDVVPMTAAHKVGYKLVSLTVKFGEEELEVTDNQFTMPAGEVTVSAVFQPAEYWKIYFQNNKNWTKVGIHYWGNGETQWPGKEMTLVEGDNALSNNGKSEVFVCEIPENVAGFLFTGINEKEGAVLEQTADITEGFSDGICYYVQDDGTAGIFDPNAVEYNINVEDSKNGTVTASDTAREGAPVVLKAAPDEGYLLESLTVKFGDEELEVTNNQFTMPAGDVTVTATFREITEEDFVTIYFRNNWLWSDVCIYFWGSENFTNPAWPGIAMEKFGEGIAYSDGKRDVYTYNIPADVDGFIINGVNGTNEDGTPSRDQTPNIEEGFYDGVCYRMQWSDGNQVEIVPDPSVKYDITVEAAENGEVVAPENAAEEEVVTLTVTPAEGYELASLTVLSGEEELTVNNNQFTMPAGNVTVTATFQPAEDPGDEPEEKTTMTVYFQNNWMWTDVNAYYWGSTTNTNPGWPGVAMTKVENPVAGYSDNGTYEVYSVEVPLDATGLIINGVKDDGSGYRDQTPNITNFCDGICYFMTWNDGNQAGAMISPEVAPETPVKEWNISLGDNIGVNFRVNAAIADHLEFSIGGTALTKQVTANGDGTSTVSVGLAAAQMADTITIKGCGAAYEKTYSVVDYTKDILGGEYSDETKALVTEMLNYGAAAQMHFQYNTENLVKEDYTKDQSLTLEAAAVEVADSMNGLGYYGASLLFRNKIAVRFYFTGSVEDCTFTVGENTYEPVLKDGRYYVEVADIAPDALDQQITLKVTDANGAEISVTYGPMNYIKRMYEKEDTSDSLKDVLECLYHYHKAAVAYVASLSTEA